MATNTQPKGVLVDLTKCIGCRSCQIACKNWNGRSVKKTVQNGTFTNPVDMNSEAYTVVKFVETEKDNMISGWDFIKTQCMHCKDPACASACPVGAFEKKPNGPVMYHAERCIGCRYCMMACPFNVPKYEWEKISPIVQKCTFCSDRQEEGLTPACVKACAPKALYFGNYNDVVAEAERRIKENPGKYVNHIYGKDEAGGTSWMYISGVPFEKLGFKTNIPKVALPELSWAMLKTIPIKVGGLITILAAIAYIRNRGNGGNGSGQSKNEREG
ncbi:MAG: 4Fe-4S dicluster domain-containing protein [Nitrospirota bacterium]